jgi:immune inhibitor A
MHRRIQQKTKEEPMRKRLLVGGALILVAVLAAAALSLVATGGASSLPGSAKGFSAARLNPDAETALKAAGKPLPNPFPNYVNKGRKFNPTGDVVGRLTTAAQQKVLVLFVDFTTTPPGALTTRLDLGAYFDPLLFGTVYDPPEYDGIANHPTDRTLVNYYHDVSYGAVHVTTDNLPSAMGWKPSGHPYDYYCKADGIHDNGFGPFPQNAQGLVIDAVHAADAAVDFSQYAVNGEVPNLFVVFAGTGAEWSGAADIIWSHSWDLTEGTGSAGIIADGVRINNYAMMPEVGGDLTGFSGTVSGPFPPTVGVYAHEYGHVLGLPDQYDYGYESEGTGMYSLMAGGSWNRYPNERILSGNSPAQLDAWSKYRLGFVTPTTITTSTPVTLPDAETHPVVYKMVVPNSGGKEYFLFENRQQIGWDLGFSRRGPNTHGLAIYHVDDTVLTRNYWRPNEAENWKEFRSEGARKDKSTGETHYGISIMQADDKWDLEHGVYLTGYDGDLYPGALNVASFSSLTKPNSSNYYFWGGSAPKYGYSGVTLTNITETAGVIGATFKFVPWTSSK